MKATTVDAYRLLHEGSLALADVEANGIRIDVARLDEAIEETDERIGRLTEELKGDEVWKSWRRRFGAEAKLGSRQQLGEIVYGEMGCEPASYTSGGKSGRKRPSVDEESLSATGLPFVEAFLELEKLKKLRSTYLIGVKREVVDGYLRPSFNLHLARSYRSSCDCPNFQNIPIRDKLVGKLIRSCFVPRDGHVLVEMDYGGHEFRIAACFWRDPEMVAYASDSARDIHRDMAADCYLLCADEVSSETRFFAKNQFVFPMLYGSYYVNCARNLWNVIDSGDLKTAGGIGLKVHLADKGIDRLGRCDSKREPEEGTFERHVYEVERRFAKRFPVWSERKEKWWDRYQKRGWFPLMTGFRISGYYSRNQAFNIPIQGPAFHCLLWSLTRLNEWLVGNGMRSVIVGQIHDSIVADVHRDELDDYLVEAKRIMTKDLRREWGWIVVPLFVEAEVAETNWFEKRRVEI